MTLLATGTKVQVVLYVQRQVSSVPVARWLPVELHFN